APVDEVSRVAIFSDYPSKVFYLGNFISWFAAVRLNTPIERPYATAFGAGWSGCCFNSSLGTTIFATDKDLKKGKLFVLFRHRCSKTLFVRALATECNLPLVAVQASRIFGRFVGDSERNMQRILMHARACAPAILFIDEIDLLLPSRSSSESGVSEHVLGEVLTAMDGVEGQCGQLLLIAATNRLENLDPLFGKPNV
ncbi:unnamed protein product, partial [Dibothriocephalus latus]